MKKLFSILTIATIVFVIACQKDVVSNVFPTNSPKNFMTVQKAKEWFDEKEPTVAWTQPEKRKRYQPQWDQAVQLNGAVEVPVLLDSMVIQPTINLDNPKQKGVMRLLIASLDNRTIDAAIIKYHPTDKFVGNIEEINRDNFREKKFDGMIKLENFDFTDQKVVLIEKGELTHFMGKNDKYNPNREDYMICYQSCGWVTGYITGGMPTVFSTYTCSGTYCVIVPTGFLPGSNGNPDPIVNSDGGISGGTNNAGSNILTQNPPITTTNRICASSFQIQSYTDNSVSPPVNQNLAGLVDVNIQFPNGLQTVIGYLTIQIGNNSVSPTGLAQIFNSSVLLLNQIIGTNQLNQNSGASMVPTTNSQTTDVFKDIFTRQLGNTYGAGSVMIRTTTGQPTLTTTAGATNLNWVSPVVQSNPNCR